MPTEYPLTVLRSENPERILADPLPNAQWIAEGAGFQPALLSKDSFAVAFRVDDLEPRTLLGEVFVGPGGAGTATFRVRSKSSPEDPGTLLFEKRLEAKGSATAKAPVRLDLPAPPVGARFLALEAELGPWSGEAARLGWIAPRLEGEREAPRLPRGSWNAIVITSDTTRRDFLGPYGGPAATPNLDRLATEGVVLDNAYSVAFGTTPSHASLLTSSPAAIHGVYGNSTVLPDDRLTLAEVLRDRGWATAAFVSAMPVARALGFDQGFDVYDDLFLSGWPDQLDYFSLHERRAETTLERFSTWLSDRSPEPFFAWLHFFDPHQPYCPLAAPPPAASLSRYFPPPGTAPIYLQAEDLLKEAPELLPAIAAESKARYCLEISNVDAAIGAVLAALAERGLEDHTVVIYLADHGENFLDHDARLAFNHATTLEPVSHIPALLWAPARLPGGRRSDALVGNLDIAPTLLELLGVPRPETWAGRSVLGSLDNQRPFRDHLVLEGAYQEELAVRSERWLYRRLLDQGPTSKGYLGFADRHEEVYEIGAAATPIDPGACPDLPALRKEADRFLAGKRRIETSELDGEALTEALRALGYLR